MKKINLLIISFIAFAFTLASCSEEKDEPTPELETQQITFDATSYTDWVYIALSTGQVVEVTDPQNDTNWDLGFHRWDVRTNGGMSGSGEGAAIQLNETQLEQVSVAPESGYATDLMMQINMTGMPPVYEDHPANPELAKWMDLDTSVMPPIYTMQENVFVIKTTDGKYAKIKFTDYMNEMGDRGYITLKYVLQSDGSRNF